jgi:hypothetical protein
LSLKKCGDFFITIGFDNHARGNQIFKVCSLRHLHQDSSGGKATTFTFHYGKNKQGLNMKLFMCAYVALAVVVPSSTSQSFVDGIRGPRIEQKEIRHDEHEGGKGNGEGSHYDKCSTGSKHKILSPLSATDTLQCQSS